MKSSMEEIKMSLTSEKKKEDSQLCIYVHRPLSYPLTYLFIKLGISAWTVSMLSAIIAFLGCMLLCLSSSWLRWIGILLINLWAILDCVDGNIARVTKTQSSKGAFMDAESGYMICGFVYIAFGMAAYHTAGDAFFVNKYIYIFLGAMASISDLLARLIHQKYVSSVVNKQQNEDTDKKSNLTKFRKRVSTEIGIAGLVLVGAIFAQMFNLYNYVVLFYGTFNFLTLLLTATIYSKKARG